MCLDGKILIGTNSHTLTMRLGTKWILGRDTFPLSTLFFYHLCVEAAANCNSSLLIKIGKKKRNCSLLPSQSPRGTFHRNNHIDPDRLSSGSHFCYNKTQNTLIGPFYYEFGSGFDLEMQCLRSRHPQWKPPIKNPNMNAPP